MSLPSCIALVQNELPQNHRPFDKTLNWFESKDLRSSVHNLGWCNQTFQPCSFQNWVSNYTGSPTVPFSNCKPWRTTVVGVITLGSGLSGQQRTRKGRAQKQIPTGKTSGSSYQQMDSGGKAKKTWWFSNPCLSDWIFNDTYMQLTNETHQELESNFFSGTAKNRKTRTSPGRFLRSGTRVEIQTSCDV